MTNAGATNACVTNACKTAVVRFLRPDDERVVGGDLAGPLAALKASGWRLFHDVRRLASPLVRLDHVAIGPAGLVVVQQVVFDGVVTVEDATLRLNSAPYTFQTRAVVAAVAGLRVEPVGFRSRRRARDGALDGALDGAAGGAVEEGAEQGADLPLRTVLCMVPAELEHAVVRPDVHVVGRAGLAPLVADAPAVLDAAAVTRVHAALARTLRAGDGLRRPRYPLPR